VPTHRARLKASCGQQVIKLMTASEGFSEAKLVEPPDTPTVSPLWVIIFRSFAYMNRPLSPQSDDEALWSVLGKRPMLSQPRPPAPDIFSRIPSDVLELSLFPCLSVHCSLALGTTSKATYKLVHELISDVGSLPSLETLSLFKQPRRASISQANHSRWDPDPSGTRHAQAIQVSILGIHGRQLQRLAVHPRQAKAVRLALEAGHLPSLTSLSITAGVWGNEDFARIPAFLKLRELTLTSERSNLTPIAQPNLLSQLGKLTSLRSLSMTCDTFWSALPEGILPPSLVCLSLNGYSMADLAALATQLAASKVRLQRLTIKACTFPRLEDAPQLISLLRQVSPSLEEASLAFTTQGDAQINWPEVFEVLTSTPNLKILHVAASLFDAEQVRQAFLTPR
jgi:hypothetical protein